MDITDLTFRLLFLFLPGIISVLIIEDRTLHKKWEPYRFVLYSFLNGLLSYIIIQLIWGIIQLACFTCKVVNASIRGVGCEDLHFKMLDVWSKLFQLGDMPFVEIFLACVVSVLLGLFGVYFIEKKLLYKVTTRLGLSQKFGDESLFYNFLTTEGLRGMYLHDLKNQLTYHGYIYKYAEEESAIEILMINTDVYKYKTSQLLDSVESIYIRKAFSDDLIIEVPKIEDNGEAEQTN